MSQSSHDRSKNILASLSELFGALRHFTAILARAKNLMPAKVGSHLEADAQPIDAERRQSAVACWIDGVYDRRAPKMFLGRLSRLLSEYTHLSEIYSMNRTN